MNKAVQKGNSKDYFQLKIEEIHQIAPEVYLLSFKRTFNFIPGQVIGVTDDIDVPARMYSISSGTGDSFIRIIFDVKKGGYLTPSLSALKNGDRIFITKPYGSFICDDSPAFWIATGTGIAPFASMFFSGNSTNKTLIHGARFLDSFYFSDHFAPVLGENYIRCCSAEKNDNVFEGRVTKYLSLHISLSRDIKYYICGRAEMVVESRDILISKGVPFDNINAEIYF